MAFLNSTSLSSHFFLNVFPTPLKRNVNFLDPVIDFFWLTHIFIKLSHNVCLINTHTFWCINMLDVTASYGMPFDFIAFFGIFIYNWRFISEVLYLHHIYFQRLCVWTIYTFWYVNMPNVTTGYGRFSDLIMFYREFSNRTTCLKRYNKLLQTVC